MSDYSHEMPELKSKFFCVSIRMYQSDDMGFTKASLELQDWAKKHNKCIGYYVNYTDVFLEFSEEKLASNLKILLSSIDRISVKRMNKLEFEDKIQNLKNYLNKIITNTVKETNVRAYDYETVLTKTGEDDEYTLETFKLDIKVKDLKNFHGMVSRISFNNPEEKEIIFKLNGSQAPIEKTTGNCIEFYNTFGHITKGIYNSETAKYFPEYCEGDVSKHYVNFARIDDFELCGLSPDDFITVETYTIFRMNKYLKEKGSIWISYSFSV